MAGPALLINLARSPERLQRMQAQFAVAGLPFVRMEAIDGHALDAVEISRWVPGPGTIRHLVPAEVGCFLSHRACWTAAIASGGRGTIVFEDDIHLSPRATVLLGDLSWIPTDADVVKLETTLGAFVLRSGKPVADRRQLGRLHASHFGTAGYIVTPRGAEKLLALSETFVDPVDDFMFNRTLPGARRLISYQLVPALCMQDRAINGEANLGSFVQPGRRLMPSQRPPALQLVWREVKRPFVRHTPTVVTDIILRATGRRRIDIPFV